MPKVWNIGNTTVRNPKRIETALRVFMREGFSGNAKGVTQETRLHQALKDNEVLDFVGLASDWNGRKWRAAFYQLGFISFERYNIGNNRLRVDELFNAIGDTEVRFPFQITRAGLKLVDAKRIPEIEDIYVRQFACYELPNSLERSFPDGKLKPFILFLQVLSGLQERGLDGLTKFETGLFLQRFYDHTTSLAQSIVEEIILFRERCLNKDRQELNEIKKEYLDRLAADTGIDPNSIVKDYADTTFRYFNLSGLFSRIGETIVIRNQKKEFVTRLLLEEPRFLFNTEPVSYFKFYYNNTYPIPTDDLSFALQEIRMLKSGIKNKANPLFHEANQLGVDSGLELIQNTRYGLIEYNNWEREEDYANEQNSDEAIADILRYLNVLDKQRISNPPEIDDKPAYLEWAVWRSFLAINNILNPIHETRRFPVDQDFFPRNTAPGGGSDLLFEFETYVLVVEVTLTESHRQMSSESEPVRRHAVQYKLQYPDKDVYCLFLAPTVDNNVVETFRIGVWYNGDDEEFVNIIPMSIGDFILVFRTLKDKRFSNDDFKRLLDRSLIFRNVRAPQWKALICKEVIEWCKRILP